MPITLTLDLDPSSAITLDVTVEHATSPVATPASTRTRWDVRAVNQRNTVISAFYPEAQVLSITWNYNQPDQAEVAIPIDDANLTALDPDMVGTREIQIWRNDYLLFVGKPWQRRADDSGRMMIFSCKDPTSYLQHRYIGRANRVNRLSNGSFESGGLAPWAKTDPDASTTLTIASTHRVLGTDALRVVSTDVTSAPYVYQAVVASAGVSALRLFLTGWCFISNWTGPAPFEAGLLLIRLGATGAGRYSYAKVKATTERNQWVRLETFVRVPPNTTEYVEARLFAIDGTIWWDAVTLVADEHIGWGDGVDEGQVVGDVVRYLQGKGKFANLSPEKTDCFIRPVMPTTGNEIQSGRSYRLADHQKGFDGGPSGSGVLDHYLNAQDGIDWRFEPQGRILRGHYPFIGEERTDVTFTFRKFPTAPERNGSWGIVGWDFAESIEQAANQIVELGGWGGTQYPGDPSREEGAYQDLSTLGGVSLELVETAPQGTPISQLDARAQARGRRLARPVQTPRLKIVEVRDPDTGEVEYPLIGVLLPGDRIAVDVVDGRFVLTGEWRVAQVVLDGQTEELTVTPNPVLA